MNPRSKRMLRLSAICGIPQNSLLRTKIAAFTLLEYPNLMTGKVPSSEEHEVVYVIKV
jgi:hypothetical protein